MTCNAIQFNAVASLGDPQLLVVGYEQDGAVAVFDFSTTTAVAARFYTAGVLVDEVISGEVAGLFDWAGGDGELWCDFGLAGLDPGTYQVLLVVTNPDYPDGRALNRGDGYTLDLVVTA